MSPREHAARLRELPRVETKVAKLQIAGQLARVLLVHGEAPEFVRGAQDRALKADVHEGDCPSFDEVG